MTSWMGAAVLFVGIGLLFSQTARADYAFESIDTSTIDIGGEIGRRIDVTVKNNILVVNVDKHFIKPFQTRSQPSGFVGLGMFLDGIVRLAHHTGHPALIARKDHVVKAALAAQQDDGYLGMMKEESRIHELWDVHEMAYILIGLISEATLFENDEARAVAVRLGDFLLKCLTDTPPPGVYKGDLSPTMPGTGLADAFLSLSEVTGDAKYREFCLNVQKMAEWRKPIVKGRHWPIDGHIYAYIDKCLVQLRLDPDGRDPGLHEATNAAVEFLLRGNGLTISGGCGDHECWQDTQAGMNNLGETCATVYLLRFFDQLLRQSGDSIYGDLMERLIHNALFGAQSPDGRRLRYYTGFEAPRRYFDLDTYCCPNNYRRGMADLPGYVLYRSKDGLAVNLYTACTAEATLKDGTEVTLVQETQYPNEGDVALRLSLAGKKAFPLSLRVPRWCTAPSVAVNGEAAGVGVTAGTYCVIDRTWSDGDTVQLTFPMELRLVKGRRSQIGKAAVMRGPQIFTFNPERNDNLGNATAREMTLDPEAVAGPVPDDSVHKGGLACTIGTWKPTVFYPTPNHVKLVLTEFADPGSVATYFTVNNPDHEALVDDELFLECAP